MATNYKDVILLYPLVRPVLPSALAYEYEIDLASAVERKFVEGDDERHWPSAYQP